MLAWPKVRRPPDLGGLGFLNLQLFGYALRMRWLWIKRTDENRPWSQLPDKHDSIVLSMFQASTSIELGDGSRSFFWTHRWLHGQSVRLRLEVGFQLEELHWIMNAKADWKWKWITMPMLLFGCICNG